MAKWKPAKKDAPARSRASAPEPAPPRAEPFPSAPDGEDLSSAPEDPEVKVGRSLSRVFAGLSQEDLAPVVQRILKQASDGDTQAQALFLRLESLLAAKPVEDQDNAAIKPVHVETAERALAALVKKVQARLPDEACPWCGHGAAE